MWGKGVKGISDLITTPGIINVDFADIKAILKDAGSALMGIGYSSGEKRAEEAAKSAFNSPLLDLSITGAKGVLFAIAGGDDLTLNEINEAAKTITESIDKEAKVIFGAIKDDRLNKKEIKVTVIASGFPENGSSNSGASQLFSFSSTVKQPQTTSAHHAESKKEAIHNSLPPTITASSQPQKESKEKTIVEADDDDWAAVPAFLRRNKK